MASKTCRRALASSSQSAHRFAAAPARPAAAPAARRARWDRLAPCFRRGSLGAPGQLQSPSCPTSWASAARGPGRRRPRAPSRRTHTNTTVSPIMLQGLGDVVGTRTITSEGQKFCHMKPAPFANISDFPAHVAKMCAFLALGLFSNPTSASFRTQRGPTRRRPLLTHPLFEVSTTCVSDRGRAPASSDIL